MKEGLVKILVNSENSIDATDCQDSSKIGGFCAKLPPIPAATLISSPDGEPHKILLPSARHLQETLAVYLGPLGCLSTRIVTK